MRAALFAPVLVSLFACACSRSRSEDIPVFANARSVCAEDGYSIYASTAHATDVARFYGSYFGARNEPPEITQKGATTTLHGRSGTVVIYPRDFGSLPRCVPELPPEELTVIALPTRR
jgi:hypothetical protein